MVKIFNGKEFARQKELEVKKEVVKLKKKGVAPRLVSIVVGNVGGGRFYQNLKKKAAERIGAEVEIISLSPSTSLREIREKIEQFNKDSSVHGVMIQLPLPDYLEPKTNYLINIIDPKKDVDGLREDSIFLTPVVKAVIAILEKATHFLPANREAEVLLVGFTGFEGGKIFKTLKDMGYKVEGANSKTKNLGEKTKKAQVVISATGIPGLIRGKMIRKGAVVIDVGAPRGDVRTEEITAKAALISPVPGGVGPVTISMLMENLVEKAKGIENKI